MSCLDFVCTVDYPQGYLVSGSGDSTVSICKLTSLQVLNLAFCIVEEWINKSSTLLSQIRLWDVTSGSLLDTCEVRAKVSHLFWSLPEVPCFFWNITCQVLMENGTTLFSLLNFYSNRIFWKNINVPNSMMMLSIYPYSIRSRVHSGSWHHSFEVSHKQRNLCFWLFLLACFFTWLHLYLLPEGKTFRV